MPLEVGSQKLPIAVGIATGLSFLHSQRPSIIHRDLKPANVLLDSSSGVAALADFGIAKEVEEERGLARSFVGTAAYMAPERLVAGTEYDAFRTDAWSLGVLAFRSLARRPLFNSDDRDNMRDDDELRRLARWNARSVADAVRAVTREMREVVARAAAEAVVHAAIGRASKVGGTGLLTPGMLLPPLGPRPLELGLVEAQ